jgi:hypothetical protein
MVTEIENNQQYQANVVPKHIRLIYQHLLAEGQNVRDVINLLNIRDALLRRLFPEADPVMWSIEDALDLLRTYGDNGWLNL